MAKERDLQAYVERLVKDGELLDAVSGREEVHQLFEASMSQSGIPAFPIDSLLRRAAVAAAAHVLGRLKAPRLVSADRNVSLDGKDILRPDLVVVDDHTRSVTCMELKTSTQSERQALTELLAYEHEIRNHLPFVSDLDLCFVLVAVDYSTLLDHAVSTHIAWYGKNILCLLASPGATSGDWKLAVHIPQAWTNLGQTGIPPGAILTQSTRFAPRRQAGPDDRRTGLEAVNALEHAVRVAEYSGSHGFVVLWKHQTGVFELTTGVVEPRTFIGEAVQRGVLSEPSTPFGKEILGELSRDSDRKPPAALADLTKVIGRFLEFTCDTRPADVEGWTDLVARQEFTVLPALIGFFGAPGRWVTGLLGLPGLWRWLPEMRAHGWSPEMVRVAWPILMELLGQRVLPRAGEIDCRFAFDLGCHLAFASRAASIENRNAQLEVAKYWNDLWLDAAVREIVFRFNASEDDDLPPPPIDEFNTSDPQSLDEFVEWLVTDFFRGGPVQAAVLRWGLSHPTGVLPAGPGGRRQAGIGDDEVQDARAWLDTLVKRAEDDPAPWDEAFLEALAELLGGPGTRPVEPARLRDHIAAMAQDELSAAIVGGLPDVLDKGVEPAFHRLAPMQGHEAVDWEQLRHWFKGKTVDDGRYPCLRVEPDGRFGTGFQEFPVRIWEVDYDREVIVLDCRSGATFSVEKVAWDQLPSWFETKSRR